VNFVLSKTFHIFQEQKQKRMPKIILEIEIPYDNPKDE